MDSVPRVNTTSLPLCNDTEQPWVLFMVRNENHHEHRLNHNARPLLNITYGLESTEGILHVNHLA